jgi:hypothetical protein
VPSSYVQSEAVHLSQHKGHTGDDLHHFCTGPPNKSYTGWGDNPGTNSHIFCNILIIFLYILNVEPPKQS